MFTLYTIFVTLLYEVLIVNHICLMHTFDFRLYQHKCSLYVPTKSPYIQKRLLHVPSFSPYIVQMFTLSTFFVTLNYKNVIHKILYYSTSYTSNTPDSLGVP